MMDGIGSTGSVRLVPTAPVASVQPADTPRPDTGAAERAVATASLAKSLSQTPPIDRERVAQIRRAIQTGTFPILPATIADRLIALKLEWNGRESA